jgi:hypothetical protein
MSMYLVLLDNKTTFYSNLSLSWVLETPPLSPVPPINPVPLTLPMSAILEDDIKAEPVMYDNACDNLYCILKLNKTHKRQ